LNHPPKILVIADLFKITFFEQLFLEATLYLSTKLNTRHLS